MPVSCFNDSRMVGANRCANSKAVGMSFLERIWLKTFSTTSVKVATSLREVVALFFLTCLAFLAFSFPFCVFLCFRMPLIPSTALRRPANDSNDSLVMYFNNSLTIWNTEMNATEKQKKSLLMERARGSCKEESMIRKAAKSSKGVMHWTHQSNQMNNQNRSKMRRISVCLYWTLISHYWPLLIIIQ